MANVLTKQVLELDTAATITNFPCRVRRLHWQPGTAGSDILVSDKRGSVKFARKSLAPTPAGDEFLDCGSDGDIWEGFVVTTIDDGVLYADVPVWQV